VTGNKIVADTLRQKKYMKHKTHLLWISILLMTCAPLLVSTFLTVSFAQEDIYVLAHENIFGELRRPPVMFSHEDHTGTLEDEGCGACHHLQDEESGRLVYVEGEELNCWECHGGKKDNQTPTLQRAYHGICTTCHRELKKQKGPDSGPTTCGGCHVKQ